MGEFQEVVIEKCKSCLWNYSYVTSEERRAISQSMKKYGQIQMLIARDLKPDIEIIDGCVRLNIMKELGLSTVLIYNYGVISEIEAKLVTFRMNETKFSKDSILFAKLISSIFSEIPFSADSNFALPYTIEELISIKKILEFDWSVFEEYQEKKKVLPMFFDE